VIVEDPTSGGNTGHQRARRERESTGNFKSSLISSEGNEASMRVEEDTVYSYLEEETEGFDREIMSINRKQKSIK
jgi:hypothetical protein